jgi:hypothetical protein
VKIILFILKYLISTILIYSSMPAEGVDGWFSVPKQPKIEDQAEEDDPSIWVLFSKSLGAERILVRFPEVPTYRYSETGELVITSQRNGEIYQLNILSGGSETPAAKEFHSEAEGKWVHEHFVQSSHHFFHFKTTSLTPSAENHREFISSFLIERNV